MPEYQDSVDPPGGYGCERQPGDETTGPTPDGILAYLDELLAPTGGSYSASGLPMKQALQYSLIALNRQNHEALMGLIGVLVQTIIARNQYCEDTVNKLAAPFRRTIRGRIKAQENAVNGLIGQLANAVTARTTFAQQMLGDCQCKMLGAEQPSENTPMGDGESGIPARSDYPLMPGDSQTPSESSTPFKYTPKKPAGDCTDIDICPDGLIVQWLNHFRQFELPRLLHAFTIACTNKASAVSASKCCRPLIEEIGYDEVNFLVEIAKGPDGQKKLYDHMKVDNVANELPEFVYEFIDNPVNLEHFPTEEMR